MKRLRRRYEGPQELLKLLKASGCILGLEEIIEEFRSLAEEEGAVSEVLPLFWESEPRFSSPEEAERTFSNLFGLWDEIAGALDEELLLLPEPGQPLSPRFVSQAWRELEGLSERERSRALDQFDNRQGDLGVFLMRSLEGLSAVALETAMDLAFETLWISTRARGLQASLRLDQLLRAQEELDDPEAEPEPALADLALSTLWEQNAAEERPLDELEIPQVMRSLRSLRRCLQKPK